MSLGSKAVGDEFVNGQERSLQLANNASRT